MAVVVGQRVQRYRKARGLTGQELSVALADLGVQLKRNVIGNLESGYRRTVSLAEVLALAYVLGVPPVLLMTPLGERDEVDAVPGHVADPWDVARWITGEGLPPDGIPDAVWKRNVALLELYREHQSMENEWRRQTLIDPRGREGESSPIDWDRVEQRRTELERALELIRGAIRGRGDLPPALRPELAHLDDGEPEPRLRPTVQAPPAEGGEAAVERAIERRDRRRSRQEGTTGE